jgi:hypothetical protein
MARKNNLEVSPAQDAGAVQQVRARVEYPSRTNIIDRADTRENDEAFQRSEDDDEQHNGTIYTGSRHDELDSEDAEDLAGLINGASLSGANIPARKPADRTSEGTFSRTFNSVKEFFTGSSQKPAVSLGGNNNPTGPVSTLQTRGKRQPPLQEIPDISAALSGDKTIQGKNLARPNTVYEDISKTQKQRSSGKPNPYEVPQSPPGSPAPEAKPIAPKRRGPKPKRPLTPQQVAMVVEEAPASAEEELAESQEDIERTEKAPGPATRTMSAGEERNARPKRDTRSTHTKAPDDLEEFQRQREKRQRMAMKESREHLQFSSLTQSWASISKGQFEDPDSGNQAGPPAADLVEPQNKLQGFSRTKTQSKNKGSMSARRDPQLGGNIQITPTMRHSEIEKGSTATEDNDQTELRGISQILSGPTPAQQIHDSPRQLQRPSQRPSLVPKSAQVRISNASTQQVTKEHPVRRPANAQISESAHDGASDEEDNIQHEFDLSAAPTLRVTVSNEDDATSFIDEETLQYLRLTMRKAGERKGERVVRDDDYWTSHARVLTRGVTRLISKYKAMKDLRSANVVDVGRIDMEHGRALMCLDIIREKSQVMLTSRLGDQDSGGRNADEKSRSHMLEDLYVYIIPGLVEALYRAVHSRQDRKAFQISDLEEFYAILKILYDLVEVSRNEDKKIQPKAPRTNSYSISQPTRILRPILKKLYNECGEKLAARKVAVKAEQIRQALPDRARKRKERLEDEQRKEEEQFQQRLRERNKAIIASLDERRAELGLPPCSQSTEASSTSQRPQTPKYNAEGPFDKVYHDTNGRLTGVFGSRRQNWHPGTTPKEWTVDEMEILVDGLRRDRGMYRFWIISTDLEVNVLRPYTLREARNKARTDLR